MGDVIPSVYPTRRVGGDDAPWDGGAWSNTLLRNGEVVGVLAPTHPRNRSKKFYEYDVYVVHRENGTAVTKLYHNVHVVNPLAGASDRARWLLRADPSKSVDGQPGAGSKVLILCISGSERDAVILGGARDHRDTDTDVDPTAEAQLDARYNGVEVHVGDDGSATVSRSGPTTAAGDLREGVEADSVGASAALEADGSVDVRTGDGDESLRMDRPAGTMELASREDFTVRSKQVHIGAGADQHAVLGDEQVAWMGDLIDAIDAHLHPTAVGPTGVLTNTPQFASLKARARSWLSTFIFLKKSP